MTRYLSQSICPVNPSIGDMTNRYGAAAAASSIWMVAVIRQCEEMLAVPAELMRDEALLMAILPALSTR